MIVAVASGKGGTGKTMTAVNLAVFLDKQRKDVDFFDCDVEQPNAHIFLQPKISANSSVEMFVPEIDSGKCTKCGKCTEICQYNALFVVGGELMFFPEMCHSCYGCFHICPEQAVLQGKKKIGVLVTGRGFGMNISYGVLDVGQVMAPPLIRRVKGNVGASEISIVDCPPGTSCPVVSSLEAVDFVVIVVEPTPFGLNDMKLLVETVRNMKIPFGVVINKSDIGDDSVKQHCKVESLNVLGEIPYKDDIAKLSAKGKIILHKRAEYQDIFSGIAHGIKGLMR